VDIITTASSSTLVTTLCRTRVSPNRPSVIGRTEPTISNR
jgi:hypothetical protein